MYICLLAYSIVSALGILAWWLSFDTSSPLAIGGVVGCIAPVLLAVFHVGCLLYKFCKKDPVEGDHRKAAIFLSITIPISTMVGAVLTASVVAVLPPNPVVKVIILVSSTAAIIGMITGFSVAASLVHCADEAAITSAVSATSIAEPTYVEIFQEEKVDECITLPKEEINKSITFSTVEKLPSAKETAI